MRSQDKIYSLFQNGTLARKTEAEICKILGLPYREKSRLQEMLSSLCKEGKIYQNDGGRYGTIEQLGLIKGTLRGNERGFAFLIRDDGEEDCFIPKSSLHGAFHGDIVLAEKVRNPREEHSDEAKVVAILQRGFSTIVGAFHRDKRAGYLIPDDRRFHREIYIPLSLCSNIPNGVKAVAKITSYPYGKAPGGEIVEILGEEDDFFAEELSLIRAHGLYEEFPPRVEKEAKRQAAQQINENDLKTRRDFRDELIVTIDGADTRDIDDAVSLKKTEDGYILGVHIADVSHYVPYGSALDKEAYERGTSVYFPDRVLPMLPKELSNGICSLNPDEDRLTLSCIMHLDKDGNVKGREIVEGVIRSSYKMTYDEITKMLDGDKQTLRKYALIADMVAAFAELTHILQEKRQANGSVSLDVKEAKIILTDDNEIIIPDYERAFSYQIIEAFMVLANETVAEYATELGVPFVYRVHEKPAVEKAVAFQEFAKTLGLVPKFNPENVRPKDYQKLLVSAEKLPAYSVLNRVMLRSMQKARYDTENVGHFGLASTCYCHFTSPIRRYPDLCIHRILKAAIHGELPDFMVRYSEFVKQAAKQSSDRERRAQDAERDVDDLYMTMYMSDRIGKEYDAVISGVTSFGLFAELENTVEGIIPIESLYGEYFYDETRMRLVGRSAIYTIGDCVKVRVHDVDFYRRRTEFRLLEHTNEGSRYALKSKRKETR